MHNIRGNKQVPGTGHGSLMEDSPQSAEPQSGEQASVLDPSTPGEPLNAMSALSLPCQVCV